MSNHLRTRRARQAIISAFGSARRARVFGSIFFGVFMAGSLSGCSKSPATSAPNGRQGGVAVPVVVAKAVSRNLPVEITSIGNVQPYSSVVVRSRITGEIQEVHFKEGDEVKAGDLLFKIDPRAATAAVQQFQANLARDEAQYESARLDYLRVQKLFENKVASADDLDKAQASFKGWESTLLADHAAVSNATLNVEFTDIRSPIDGRTGNITVKAGNIVKSEDDPLVEINQIHPIYVAFSVPEGDLPQVRQRMQKEKLAVTVHYPGSTNTLAQGVLTFIDNAVDTTTGTILLKATFDNKDQVLWPGQFVEVSLLINTLEGVTVVPSQAIQSSQTGEYVFVINSQDMAEKKDVIPGLSQEGWTVVSEGVRPGENVVIDGQMRLGPNSKVKIQQPAESNASDSNEKT
jgi:multidrug efflux system membrane fusion protein